MVVSKKMKLHENIRKIKLEKYLKLKKENDDFYIELSNYIGSYVLYKEGKVPEEYLEKLKPIIEFVENLHLIDKPLLRYNLDMIIDKKDTQILIEGIPFYDMKTKTVYILKHIGLVGSYHKFKNKDLESIKDLLTNYDNNMVDVEKVEVIEWL